MVGALEGPELEGEAAGMVADDDPTPGAGRCPPRAPRPSCPRRAICLSPAAAGKGREKALPHSLLWHFISRSACRRASIVPHGQNGDTRWVAPRNPSKWTHWDMCFCYNTYSAMCTLCNAVMV